MLETQFNEISQIQDALSSWRRKYWERFCSLGSLDLKSEDFQYVKFSSALLPSRAKKPKFTFPKELVENRLDFIDGYFDEESSRIPEQIPCMPLLEAYRSYGAFLQTRTQKHIKSEKDPFVALNGAFHEDGVFIYVPENTVLESPIIINLRSQSDSMTFPKIVVYVGRGAKIHFLVSFDSNEAASFVDFVFDVTLDQGSECTIKNVQNRMPSSQIFQALRVSQKRDSRFKGLFYLEGSKISRQSMQIQLLEENAEALLQGVCSLSGNLQNHIHATVEHLAPHTTSRQHFKSLLSDESRSSFEGKIFVDSVAQKTQGYQLCNNLLLSDKAVAFAKPNLEIFADDVKASHGATVAQVDEESLFYLKSRGLSQDEAKRFLIQSFIQELTDCLP